MTRCTLPAINKAIAKIEPFVELVRGEGYHYYIFDRPGDNPAFETMSIMQMYLSHSPADRWVREGVAFGAAMRERFAA